MILPTTGCHMRSVTCCFSILKVDTSPAGKMPTGVPFASSSSVFFNPLMLDECSIFSNGFTAIRVIGYRDKAACFGDIAQLLLIKFNLNAAAFQYGVDKLDALFILRLRE